MKTMIGTILRCSVSGQLCPFNWDILADGAQYVDYVRENCPRKMYAKRQKSFVCRFADQASVK